MKSRRERGKDGLLFQVTSFFACFLSFFFDSATLCFTFALMRVVVRLLVSAGGEGRELL